MSVSESDFEGGFATDDFDAFSEIGYDGYPDFSGYDNPNDSYPVNQNYPTARYAPGGAGWYDLWGRNIDGLTNNLFDAPQASGGTVRDIQSIGTDFPSAGWLGDAIAGLAEDKGVGWENPTTGRLHSNPIDVKPIDFNIPTSPFDYSKPPTPSGLQFERVSGALNQDYTGKVNPSNMYANLNNNQMTDALDYNARQSMSNQQVADVLNQRPNASTISAVSYVNAADESMLGTYPSGYDEFGQPTGGHTPVFSYEDQNQIDSWKMGGNSAGSNQPSLDQNLFDNNLENAVMINGKTTTRNEIGNVSPGQYGDIEGNWMKPQGDTLGWRDEERQAEQMFGGDKGIADFSGNLGFGDMDRVKKQQALGSVTPGIDMLGAGAGAALGMLGWNKKDAFEFVAKNGKQAWEGLKDKLFTPNLNKMADAPFKRDHVPTIKLDPLATRTKWNPVGKDKTWQEPLKGGSKFDRRITKEDQTPSFLSNKAQRQARIDKGEVKTTSRPTGDPRAVQGYTFVPGQGKSVGAKFDKGYVNKQVKTPGSNKYGQNQFGNQAQSNKAIAENRAKAEAAKAPARVTSTGPTRKTDAEFLGGQLKNAVRDKTMTYEQAETQVKAVMRGPFSDPDDYVDPEMVKQVMNKLGIRKPGPTVWKKF